MARARDPIEVGSKPSGIRYAFTHRRRIYLLVRRSHDQPMRAELDRLRESLDFLPVARFQVPEVGLEAQVIDEDLNVAIVVDEKQCFVVAGASRKKRVWAKAAFARKAEFHSRFLHSKSCFLAQDVLERARPGRLARKSSEKIRVEVGGNHERDAEAIPKQITERIVFRVSRCQNDLEIAIGMGGVLVVAHAPTLLRKTGSRENF